MNRARKINAVGGDDCSSVKFSDLQSLMNMTDDNVIPSEGVLSVCEDFKESHESLNHYSEVSSVSCDEPFEDTMTNHDNGKANDMQNTQALHTLLDFSSKYTSNMLNTGELDNDFKSSTQKLQKNLFHEFKKENRFISDREKITEKIQGIDQNVDCKSNDNLTSIYHHRMLINNDIDLRQYKSQPVRFGNQRYFQRGYVEWIDYHTNNYKIKSKNNNIPSPQEIPAKKEEEK